ncbi:hypothetical protein EPN96_02640 [bacterium]|nr:MAG: hypothetical protein EPN96_02640 [bacterium]
MKKFRKFAVLALIGVALWGCSADHLWYGNDRALSATPDNPVPGGPEERTYVAPEAKGVSFGKVYIGPVTVRSTRQEGLPEDFTARVASSAAMGAALAVKNSERFKGVAADETEADQLLSIEALAHVSVVGQKFLSDPVLKDPRSKIFMVYTLREARGGKVLVKYSSVENSDWDYTQRVVDDLQKLARDAAQGLMFVFTEL